MPPHSLEGKTLGEKHRHFNKLVQDAVSNKQSNLTKINYTDSDIDNLLKIGTACRMRNVDYILEVLKCEDLLYVTKAINQCTWLITEQQYAHIINPDYLFTHLFPHMLTRAINKLLLHIRLHLKDEKRVEEFYNYLKTHDKPECDKWLLNCSIPFIENVLENQRYISLQMFKRLCKRSVKFLKYYEKVESQSNWRALKSVIFLIKSDTYEYLNVLETCKDYGFPTLDHKYTKIVMKKFPNRILDKFDIYKGNVDLSTVTKYMEKDKVKDFVLQQVKNENLRYFFSNYDNLKHFIKIIPKEERFEFVKKIYIDKKVNVAAPYGQEQDMCCDDEISAAACIPSCSTNSYNWYQFAPFSEAFVELKKLIRAESSPNERCAIVSVLITCAKKNPHHVKTVLQYYYDKHRNEPFKIQFVNNLIRQIPTYEFDIDTWNILDKLFHSLEVYTETENNVETCLKAIVVYKVLHDETVPDIVEKKISFDTFQKFQKKLNTEQQEKLYKYLSSSVCTKLQNITVKSESDLQQSVNILMDAFNLLIDWKKDLKENTYVFNKFQECIKIKKDNAWDVDLTSLYQTKKTWRKYVFEESMELFPSEDVCLNALKHDPQLISRYSDKINALRVNDTISLRRVLRKLRVYWQDSLAQEWIDAYLNNFTKSTGHKSLICGLFELLPQVEIEKIAKEYSPKETKIDYDKINQSELSLQKHIAKKLYVARPLTSLDLVLMYAKGDYLQYAVPSLSSIINNISCVQSRDHMSKLLEAPVSLQKYGLHFVFIKLKLDELKPIFSDIWKTTKNSTIRTHLFTYTYNLLCKAKEPSVVKELWELLSMFIDNLGTEENKIIYSKLGNLKNVPDCVKGVFFKKSYKVLSSLPPASNCEMYKDSLLNYAPDIVELLDADFVENTLLGPVKEEILKSRCQLIDLLVSYVLHCKDEQEQSEKFNRLLLPVLEHAFASWNSVKDENYVVKDNFGSLTRALIWNIKKFLPLKKIFVPVKLLVLVQKLMSEKMSLVDNYEVCTIWKLTVEYIKLVSEHKDVFSDPSLENLSASDFGSCWMPDAAERIWDDVNLKVAPDFAAIIINLLKEDTKKYFPSILSLFSSALSKTFDHWSVSTIKKMEILKHMLKNNDYVPSYIVVCQEMPVGKFCSDDEKKVLIEILKDLSAHPSSEVKMHYGKAFGDITFLLTQ